MALTNGDSDYRPRRAPWCVCARPLRDGDSCAMCGRLLPAECREGGAVPAACRHAYWDHADCEYPDCDCAVRAPGASQSGDREPTVSELVLLVLAIKRAGLRPRRVDYR